VDCERGADRNANIPDAEHIVEWPRSRDREDVPEKEQSWVRDEPRVHEVVRARELPGRTQRGGRSGHHAVVGEDGDGVEKRSASDQPKSWRVPVRNEERSGEQVRTQVKGSV